MSRFKCAQYDIASESMLEETVMVHIIYLYRTISCLAITHHTTPRGDLCSITCILSYSVSTERDLRRGMDRIFTPNCRVKYVVSLKDASLSKK
jgi:hypothetical protein